MMVMLGSLFRFIMPCSSKASRVFLTVELLVFHMPMSRRTLVTSCPRFSLISLSPKPTTFSFQATQKRRYTHLLNRWSLVFHIQCSIIDLYKAIHPIMTHHISERQKRRISIPV